MQTHMDLCICIFLCFWGEREENYLLRDTIPSEQVNADSLPFTVTAVISEETAKDSLAVSITSSLVVIKALLSSNAISISVNLSSLDMISFPSLRKREPFCMVITHGVPFAL